MRYQLRLLNICACDSVENVVFTSLASNTKADLAAADHRLLDKLCTGLKVLVLKGAPKPVGRIEWMGETCGSALSQARISRGGGLMKAR